VTVDLAAELPNNLDQIVREWLTTPDEAGNSVLEWVGAADWTWAEVTVLHVESLVGELFGNGMNKELIDGPARFMHTDAVVDGDGVLDGLRYLISGPGDEIYYLASSYHQAGHLGPRNLDGVEFAVSVLMDAICEFRALTKLYLAIEAS
jgi:hypothetical protein